jgi:spermidine synthase
MKQKPQIPALKSLLSYISPVTIEITSSSFNPYLEVILEGGKFSLNSRNTNYSYGSLHTLFKKTFRKLNLHWETINNALILGFGTGCVAKTINDYNPRCRIDGVEIDRKVIELGRKYFSTNELRNTTIHHFGAETYIAECKKKYDLVIIDVYNDIDVPAEIESERFLINVLNVLESGGIVIFNKFIYSKSTADQLSSLEELYKKIFRNLEVITIMNSGKVFIAKKQM